MPALDNQRWEQFAQFIVAGETQAKAYELAFGNDHDSVRVSASDLVRKQPVAERILELRKSGLGSAPILTLMEKRAFLASVVRVAPSQVNEHDPRCQGYKVRRDKDGAETIEYELPNKLKALELDAKLAGELNGSPTALRISMFTQGQVIDVEGVPIGDELSLPPGEHRLEG